MYYPVDGEGYDTAWFEDFDIVTKTVVYTKFGYDVTKEVMPDFLERIFYICGPPRMVDGMKDILKNKLNLPENMIKIENFAGY